MAFSDPQVRLMRWRLPLMELEYEISYRPVLVRQIRDVLSRLEKPDTTESDAVAIDAEIPLQRFSDAGSLIASDAP